VNSAGASILASKENGAPKKPSEMRDWNFCRVVTVGCLGLAAVAIAEGCASDPCLRGMFRDAAALDCGEVLPTAS
jgi:hypothetical protein